MDAGRTVGGGSCEQWPGNGAHDAGEPGSEAARRPCPGLAAQARTSTAASPNPCAARPSPRECLRAGAPFTLARAKPGRPAAPSASDARVRPPHLNESLEFCAMDLCRRRSSAFWASGASLRFEWTSASLFGLRAAGSASSRSAGFEAPYHVPRSTTGQVCAPARMEPDQRAGSARRLAAPPSMPTEAGVAASSTASGRAGASSSSSAQKGATGSGRTKVSLGQGRSLMVRRPEAECSARDAGLSAFACLPEA